MPAWRWRSAAGIGVDCGAAACRLAMQAAATRSRAPQSRPTTPLRFAPRAASIAPPARLRLLGAGRQRGRALSRLVREQGDVHAAGRLRPDAGASLHGTADMRPGAHGMRDAVYLLAAATGVDRHRLSHLQCRQAAGGFSWQNLFYGAPLGAPMAHAAVRPARILLGAGAR